jgi:ferredoxin
MIRHLSRKGYEVFYERVFSIGSNWINKFDDKLVKQLYEATSKKVSIMCREVDSGEKRILKTGWGLKMLMEGMMFSDRFIFPLVGKDLTVNKECIHCGLCIKNCPAENIYEKNGKVKFKFSCNCCMKCVYSCPKSAIKFRLLSFFSVSGGYNIEKILKQPSGTSEKSNKIPKFFYSYLKDDKL